MAVAGRAYVVREDSGSTGPGSTGQGSTGPGSTGSGNVDRLYPYTLKGLTEALEEARFRSFAGAAQVVAVTAESGIKLIRKYEHGREVGAEGPPA
jgi:hypothetical protein